MKRLIVSMSCCLLLLCITTVSAQSPINNPERVKQLSKENAAMMKTLKKQHKLRNITIELEENDGWHYSVTAKGDWMGIIDRDGNVIIEPYYFNLRYVPALPEGMTEFIANKFSNAKVEIWHPARPAHYVGNPGKVRRGGLVENDVLMGFQLTSILDTNGNIIKADIPYRLTEFPGYYAVGATSLTASDGTDFSWNDTGHKVGLMTSLGEMIFEPEYRLINILFGYHCYVHKYIDNIPKQGGMNLKRPDVIVPCIYEQVTEKGDGKWVVKLNRTSKEEIWNPAGYKTMTYRDEGEKFFDQFQYQKVIDYYANEGVGASWAKFFSGTSLVRMANSSLKKLSDFATDVRIGYYDTKIPTADFQLIYNQLYIGRNLLEIYQKQDSEFDSLATISIKDCSELMEKLEEGVPQREYSESCSKLQELQAEAYARQQEELRARQQAATQFAATMNTLMSNIQSGINRSQTPYRKTTNSSKNTLSRATSDNTNSSAHKQVVKKQITCNSCNGDKKCSVCHGSGKSKASLNGKQTCDACSGSGKCFICDGKGYKIRYEAE